MKSQLSEFSYGFALTNELVSWISLTSAPIFPSLIEEGKAGGGYDVKLDSPGVPLFIQFKRSDCMTRKSSREYKDVKNIGGQLDTPYYRFPITLSSLSAQHEMLLELDDGTNHVFYAAPKFHTINEINSAWRANNVAKRSIFISPNSIGHLDEDQHNIAYDKINTWRCSVPEEIDAINSIQLQSILKHALDIEKEPLNIRLKSLLSDMDGAEKNGRKKALERRMLSKTFAPEQHVEEKNNQETTANIEVSNKLNINPQESIKRMPVNVNDDSQDTASRTAKPLNNSSLLLRKAADYAARIFDAQLIIIQSNDVKSKQKQNT